MSEKSPATIEAEIAMKKAKIAVNDAENELGLRNAEYNTSAAHVRVAQRNDETVKINDEINNLIPEIVPDTPA